MVDNRFTPKNEKLAYAIGVCGNAPLGDQQVDQQQQMMHMRQMQLQQQRPQHSVGQAFGDSSDGWSNAPRPPQPGFL